MNEPTDRQLHEEERGRADYMYRRKVRVAKKLKRAIEMFDERTPKQTIKGMVESALKDLEGG